MSQNKRFHFYVKDKDGHIEMEIFYNSNGKFSVHYPRYETTTKGIHANNCFAEMLGYQVSMLIFAYNESELERFDKEFKEYMSNG